MTKREINERYFGKSALSGFKLNKEESERACRVLSSKKSSREVKELINNSRNFFNSFQFKTTGKTANAS